MATPARNSDLLSSATRATIDAWRVKYPDDRQQSVVLCALQAAQEQNGGWVTRELMDAVADYLDMPKVAVYEVGTFYSMI
ncbi:MAG: NAD(P)H-dependent oxidoreductase subunit E, partial [Gammaproteobacteria bacterium]